MQRGVLRYADFCRAVGKEGTEYVMQAVRFFGPNREFENPWEIYDADPRPEEFESDGITQRPQYLAWVRRQMSSAEV
jgi:hypothetical protein